MAKYNLVDTVRAMCDNVQEGKDTAVEAHSRRVWMKNFAAISATAGVAWACGSKKGGSDAAADATVTYTAAMKTADANTMNVALALELEAMAIYTAAAGLSVWDTGSSPLAPAFLAVAKVFLGHHTTHAAALTTQINAIMADSGVAPVTSLGATAYLAHYPGIASLSGASGLLTVLQVAAEREMNAANAYFSVIPAFNNNDLKQTLGGLTGDESAHYGVLNAAAFAHASLTTELVGTSSITAANIVNGALPPYAAYPRSVRTA